MVQVVASCGDEHLGGEDFNQVPPTLLPSPLPPFRLQNLPFDSKISEVVLVLHRSYRGTSLSRKHTSLGPYRRPMPRVLGGSWGGGCFLMSVVPLYRTRMLEHLIYM